MDVDTVIVKCEHCKKSIRLKRSLLGKRAKCPGCQVLTRLSMESFEKDTDETVQLNAESTETAGSSKSSLNDGTSPSVKQSTSQQSVQSDGASVAELTQKTIGRFRLESRVGRGGFGEVWKARDLNLDRTVAIKLPIFPPSDQRRARRFVTEAQAAARLGHPNIVAVYDAGVVENQHYLAIEFIDGKSLDEVVAESPLSELDAAKLVMELAQALAYAHDESIIHRDIKPQNIVLNSERIPKIVDFGLAKLLEQESGQTVDGTVMGTPAYMAPEQARGDIQNIGPHTDQYSLGAVLYWLITGQTPFSGPHIAVITQVIKSSPAKPSSIREGTDLRLEAICLKAMAKHPKDRYNNCRSFAEDLQRFCKGEEVKAKPVNFWIRALRFGQRHPRESLLIATMLGIFGILLSLSLTGIARSTSLARTVDESRRTAEIELEKQRQLEADLQTKLNEVEQAKALAIAAKEKAEIKQQETLAASQRMKQMQASNASLELVNEKRLKEFSTATEFESKSAIELQDVILQTKKADFASDPNRHLIAIRKLIDEGRWDEATNDLDLIPLTGRNFHWKLLSHYASKKDTVLDFVLVGPTIELPPKHGPCWLLWDRKNGLLCFYYAGTYGFLDRHTLALLGTITGGDLRSDGNPNLNEFLINQKDNEIFSWHKKIRGGVETLHNRAPHVIKRPVVVKDQNSNSYLAFVTSQNRKKTFDLDAYTFINNSWVKSDSRALGGRPKATGHNPVTQWCAQRDSEFVLRIDHVFAIVRVDQAKNLNFEFQDDISKLPDYAQASANPQPFRDTRHEGMPGFSYRVFLSEVAQYGGPQEKGYWGGLGMEFDGEDHLYFFIDSVNRIARCRLAFPKLTVGEIENRDK